MASLKLPLDAARGADDTFTAQSPTEAFFNPAETALLSPESAYFEGQTTFFNSLPFGAQQFAHPQQVLLPASAQLTTGVTCAGFSQANVPWAMPAGMTMPPGPTLLNSTMRKTKENAEQKVSQKPQSAQQTSPAPTRQAQLRPSPAPVPQEQHKKQERAPCPTAVFVDLSSLKETRK
eukprot:TRINITY_DN41939_c0_g1_i1.p1 TRINITY_DN41939_c0_g1~~TRINITY_DN41939_c0_g1_i1.p1  ORF type:complete len:203 (+),score=49.71 TRINITY_DN41939_c0_g1_i1:80-610(+)